MSMVPMSTTTPVMTERANALGWLASTPPDYPYRFAVEGPTEDDARDRFTEAVTRWETLGDE